MAPSILPALKGYLFSSEIKPCKPDYVIKIKKKESQTLLPKSSWCFSRGKLQNSHSVALEIRKDPGLFLQNLVKSQSVPANSIIAIITNCQLREDSKRKLAIRLERSQNDVMFDNKLFDLNQVVPQVESAFN